MNPLLQTPFASPRYNRALLESLNRSQTAQSDRGYPRVRPLRRVCMNDVNLMVQIGR